MKTIEEINQHNVKKILSEKKIPDFYPGDVVKVGVRITEGKKERIQYFEGVCIAKKSRDLNSSFTVRKISFGEGVERTFPLYGTLIDSIKVIRSGKVRRAKLYYLRDRTGKSARIAFDLAKKRSNKVTSCEKSNVMEAGQLWKEEVQELHDKEYKDVELSHMLADNCAMQLLRNPKQFDVIVTDNLFGDMLSDQASMLTGSLGLLPSASLGAKNKDGEMRAMYEPIHGSAPDIAGKGIANPIASILSFAMALRYSLDLDNEADSLEKAVQAVLNEGLRTKDILSEGMKETSTSAMGDAIISKLQ